jgi:glycosyltransferase involved in cell wall biosynthesis
MHGFPVVRPWSPFWVRTTLQVVRKPSGHPRSYAIVTPVRNESGNLGRIASALRAQSLLPARWVIVDTGSADETRALADDFVSDLPDLAVMTVDGPRRPEYTLKLARLQTEGRNDDSACTPRRGPAPIRAAWGSVASGHRLDIDRRQHELQRTDCRGRVVDAAT